jgi:predicted transcriptional regulator of viral defense system
MSRNIEKYKNIYKSLGPKSALLIQNLSKSGMNVFTTKDALNLIDINARNLNKILYNLVNKGWLRRIEKGKYMLIPFGVDSVEPYTESHFVIASKLISPYYIGFWSALHFYGYTEQLLNTIFIASTKRKKEIDQGGVQYKFIKIRPNHFFGVSEIKIAEANVNFSDKEKTLVDCLAYPEYCGGIQEIIKGLWKAKDEITPEKMIRYARQMDNSVIFKRLGYLLDALKLNDLLDLKQLKKYVRKGYSLLDPLLPRGGSYDSNWNLIINISYEDLLSFKRT